jgi:tetratricopeptide (TPR) repeat protein
MENQEINPENYEQHLLLSAFPAFNRMGVSPSHIQSLLEKGIAHHQADEKLEAERYYQKVLQIAPNQPDALNLLGVLAAESEAYPIAIGLMERALLTRPKDPNILNNLGHALSEVHRDAEAKDKLERAIALRPDFDEAKYNLGSVLRHMGETDRAMQLWREVWEADDRVFAALLGITNLYADKGQFDEAEAMAREVIERRPHRPGGYIALAHARKFTEDDGTLTAIEKMLSSEEAPEGDRIALEYAAGKICDDMKLFDRAFHHFDTANKAAHKAFDLTHTKKFWDQEKLVFSKRFFRERSDWGFHSDVPVFIVGMPRSGTTLTEQILAAHPDVFAAGEIESLDRIAGLATQISPAREAFPLAILKMTRAGAELVGRRYVEDLIKLSSNKSKRITNKMPHNFELLGLIATTMPDAKIIHCRREPLDTCLSCWTKNFNDAHGYNRSLTDLGQYYRGYTELMAHWRETLPIPMLEIDYEDYPRDLEGTARKIVDFVGLDWDPRCLEFHTVDRTVRTASQWQVRQPIYSTSVQRWRNYVSHLEPLIEALGPELTAAAR